MNKNLVLESTARVEDADYAILGVPFDGTQTNRTGSRDGPLAIRQTLLELDKPGFYQRKWADLGNVEAVPGNLTETLSRTRDVVNDALDINENLKFVVLGGEHTVSYAVIRALAEKGGLHVLSFDAHADMRDDYMGEKWGHSTVMRRVRELGVEVTLVGARSFSGEEKEYIEKKEVSVLGFDDDITAAVGGKRLYISVDLDVLNPEGAPGVGNPEAGGASFNKLETVINEAAGKSTVAGFDVVELVPTHDNGGTAASAARLITDMIK